MGCAITQVCIDLQPVAKRKIQPTRVAAVAVDQRFAVVQPSAVFGTHGSRAEPSHGARWGPAQPSPALQHAAFWVPTHPSSPAPASDSNGVGHAASLKRLMSGGATFSRASTRTAVTEGGSQPGACCDPAQLPETRQQQNSITAVELEEPLLSGSAASDQADGDSNVSEPAALKASMMSSSGNEMAPHARQPAHQYAKDQHPGAPPGPPHDGLSASMLSSSGDGATELHAGAAQSGVLTPQAARLAQLHAALLGCSTAAAVSAELAVLVHLLALRGEGSGGRGDDDAVRKSGGPPLITAATAPAYACAVLQASGVHECGRAIAA